MCVYVFTWFILSYILWSPWGMFHFWYVCEWKSTTACHVSKQRMFGHQGITLQPPQWWALNKLAVEAGYPSSSPHLPQRCTLRRLRMRKQDTGPRQLRCTSKGWGQWTQTLASPIHSKALNSLTGDISFSLIIKHLLMFWLPALCCKTL